MGQWRPSRRTAHGAVRAQPEGGVPLFGPSSDSYMQYTLLLPKSASPSHSNCTAPHPPYRMHYLALPPNSFPVTHPSGVAIPPPPVDDAPDPPPSASGFAAANDCRRASAAAWARDAQITSARGTWAGCVTKSKEYEIQIEIKVQSAKEDVGSQNAEGRDNAKANVRRLVTPGCAGAALNVATKHRATRA
ncbi:hypothetical protein CALCODRAFT_135136 [Calocera cornea HHB12733]|uniref:Uncharacterized protein n=1 Tax=Calocera cornea HHB12733 TaxID=1353952 RepID=A0A165CV12_9BASI|nr:hypothetical protein CALCODRAFT_135136 [Calocera cornea HHB12733]